MLGFASGMIVGFVLSVIGGGGSILALPLLVYLVGVPDPHVAIGTSSAAVAANAATGLAIHARKRTVKWGCGAMFAAAGILGTFGGSSVGQLVDGNRLLAMFALVMMAVGVLMLRQGHDRGIDGAQCNRHNAAQVLGWGAGSGTFSGFFGIGGGFLIVPSLIRSTQMPMLNAVGTSLVAVMVFGLTTSLNYARAGLVDWPLAAQLVAGGVVGGIVGSRLAVRLSNRGALARVFACVIFGVAGFMLWMSAWPS